MGRVGRGSNSTMRPQSLPAALHDKAHRCQRAAAALGFSRPRPRLSHPLPLSLNPAYVRRVAFLS